MKQDFSSTFVQCPRYGVLQTQKLKSHLLRTQSSKVLSLKTRVDKYIAMHAAPTAKDFFVADFYPPGSFTSLHFFQNLS